MDLKYKNKYLKYKNKYIELKKQYGGGEDYSWFIINGETVKETNQSEELELEQKYNNGKSVEITFKDITYYLTHDGNYAHGDKILSREQKIKNINQDEKTLFEALKTCAEQNNVVLRVAGGWVRDKILGRQNDDIDIAIDKISGQIFSNHLFKYVNTLGDGWLCSQAAIIAANAEKSKNLETATLKLTIPSGYVFELDFVGLRSEVYDDPTSRVPIVRLATASEDAVRRDLTINSLFYNINTGKIEDYIGGVRDIHCGIIRTPLDARKTFNDDPLRMLRALRFLSRFQFTLDESIKIAIQQPDLQHKLGTTISKERIGQEIDGFFKRGSEPILAFREILTNGLWNIIFGGEGDWGVRSMSLMEKLVDKSKVTILATLTFPLSELDKGKTFSKKEKNNLQKFYLEYLRLPHVLFSQSDDIHKCVFNIRDKLSRDQLSRDQQTWKRSEIAFIIRDVGEYFNNAIEVGKTLDPILFNSVQCYVKTQQLEKSYEMPYFPGSLVSAEFGVKYKSLGDLLNILLAWQFDNPGKSFEDTLKLKDEFLQQLKKN
jgi:tRNA nucleotidyltransferase/poly(A) polymerase